MSIPNQNRVFFEMSYSGSTNLKQLNIGSFSLKFDGVKSEISSLINKDIPPSSAQLLQIDLKSTSSDFKVTTKNVDWVAPRTEVAKTMSLFASVFTFNKKENTEELSNGKKNTSVRAEFREIPIPLFSLPAFESGKYYRIQIENRENELHANVVEVVKSTSDAEREKQKATKTPTPSDGRNDLFSEGMKILKETLNFDPQKIDVFGLEKIEKMVNGLPK